MKLIFNAHDDVWTNVTRKRQKGIKNTLREYHYKEYMKGGASGGIFVIWQDKDYENKPMRRAYEIIKSMSVEILENRDLVQIVKEKQDFEKAERDRKLAVVIGVEGLDFVGEDLELLSVLYMLGVRHATLTWNGENSLATGVQGNPERGLTSIGKKCVSYLEKMGVVIDVSHANEKSFWDICECTAKPIIASHSNCRDICNVSRNLYDSQLKAIGEKGGVVGLNAYSEFVASAQSERTLEKLASHIDHMVEVMGIDHVGLGFDFFQYFHDDNVEKFKEDNTPPIVDFDEISKAGNLIKLLIKKGYSLNDIEKIKYKNFIRVINECIG